MLPNKTKSESESESSPFQAQDQAMTSLEPNIRSKMKTTKTSIGRHKDVMKTCFWGVF